ncbi:hypothetical protein B0J13DRAFT_516671 [Dactylonectria estremocensis]|uniref:Xylanolytic transcriptional activator regulatory domain-containing protein n=1 Tax=Dactylonectria estremocensis TaxID=1079267 RepID=A0A9P9D066_9HYPO|nr:hypothetical protein B0J13DRAFT_516671 [Dactylonectria estremocensis]
MCDNAYSLHHFQSSGFVHLFAEDRLYSLIDLQSTHAIPVDDPAMSHMQDRLVTLYAMIAIGAQCRGHGELDARVSRTYFSRAQELAFRDMLHEPTIFMVINFLLLAFYMFCACRRNTALLYLGIAAKAATILGLHHAELNETLPPEHNQLRRRTWTSLRILDLHCNAILGRPSSVAFTFITQQNPAQVPMDAARDSHAELAVSANYNLCSLIETISQALTRPTSLDLETAEGLLQSLRDWAKALPEGLRESISPDRGEKPKPAHRQQMIGNIHVACGYYFGVLLVTRPFLVARTIPRLHQAYAASQTRLQSTFDARPENSQIQELSEACLGAAVYLVQMCHEAASLDLLLGNMCILQAWVLAAGLVLGFSLLATRETSHTDAREAFKSSQRVLAELARLSPQAQRNLEILSTFSDAISSYNSKQNPDRRQPSGGYLEQILRPGGHLSATADSEGPNVSSSQLPCVPQIVGSTMAGQPEAFEWPGATVGNFGAEVTDEIGFQQFWENYTSQFMAQGLPEGGDVTQGSWVSQDSAMDTM